MDIYDNPPAVEWVARCVWVEGRHPVDAERENEPVTIDNICNTKEWAEMDLLVQRALDPYPEAYRAVATALREDSLRREREGLR